MKKPRIILLIFTFFISLGILVGLLFFAFEQQAKKDVADNQALQDSKGPIQNNTNLTGVDGSPTPTAAEATPTPVLTATDQSDTVTVTTAPTEAVKEPIVLGFAGDVNFDESNPPASKYDSAGKGLSGILSNALESEMKAADIMMLNNEFSYSTRGTKESDKTYTFRADPSRVDILKEMGVDIVSLANNHALDYGQEALSDTFETLDHAAIEYVGAGENIDRAKAPVYFEAGGRKIAFLAASRVVFAGDWYATENGPGMIGTYDPTLILASIQDAKANSDFVVIFVHWGIERENYPVDYQRTLAKQYIDAGADAVIGCHPHVMQGFEYYKGKPIAYSLGNYIFTSRDGKSGFLKLYLDGEATVKLQLLPAVYSDTYTYLLKDKKDKKNYYDFLREISFNVNIDNDGYITEKSN